MNGFIFDENLPVNIQFSSPYSIHHVSVLGKSPSDTKIWNYAKANDLVIVTKDADFSDRIMALGPPPRVVHLRFGNMRKKDFHSFLASIWPRVEELASRNKLTNVYLNRIELVE